MTILTVYQAIHSQIEALYPESKYQEVNRRLRERFAFQPEPTPEMVAASTRAVALVGQTVRENPSLPEPEMEMQGLSQFQQQFAETLISTALTLSDKKMG